jgi:serine phosphatase RsbU (regulator of sigma subunit)/anti-sigma regulatory factor (Ser/Thr protein kinase)
MGSAFGEGVIAGPVAAGPSGAVPSPARPAGTGEAARAFAAGGDIGTRLAQLDWAAHPVGPPERWPASLLNTLGLLLSSRAQIALYWGPDLHTFYNDAYAPVIGGKHPGALAEPARDHHSELWHVLEPLLAGVLESGEAFSAQDLRLPMNRHGYLEETYFDVSYDPVRGDDGAVRGVLCIVNDTTARVVGERRLRAVSDLSAVLADATDDEALTAGAARVLDQHRADVPFSLLYLCRAGAPTLAAWSGLTGPPDRPPEPGLAVLEQVVTDGTTESAPVRHFVSNPPSAAAGAALVLPVTSGARTVGALVLGVSRHRALDEGYREFLDMIAGQLSRAMGRHRADQRQRARLADLRALTDSVVALASARTTPDVVRVAATHARALVGASRAAVTVAEVRSESGGEADAAASPAGPPHLTVPLTGAAGDELGRIDVWCRGEPEGDGGALAQFARIVALRLENTQLYEAEHRIAATLQHSLLPHSLPRVPGAVLASRYLPGGGPADIGGDWYDAVALPGGELALVIGDVVGKGVQAAAMMGQVRNALRAYLLEGFPPDEAIGRLNRLVLGLDADHVATLVCVRFEPRTGRLRFASAGHLPPVLVGRDGDVSFLHDEALGPPVGTQPDVAYAGRQIRIRPGSRLLLYTDGLLADRRRGIEAGLRVLTADAGRPADTVEDLLEHVLSQAGRADRHDDVALLGLEAGEVNRLTLRLPAHPDRLSQLRRRLEHFLTAHGVHPNDAFDLVVAVSEATANAMEHPVRPAEPVVRVTVEVVGDSVVVTVRDSGSWRAATESVVRGRGLALIGALVELDVRHDADGTTLTLRRRLERPLTTPG